MKKTTIGIITMHTPVNYGSHLQTFALYEILHRWGYEVEIIDYRYPTAYHKSLSESNSSIKGISWSQRIKKILTFFCNLWVHSNNTLLLEKMDSFYRNNIKLSKSFNSYDALATNPPMYDFYITGSDQVWNPNYVGYDKAYLLSWAPSGKRKIAYSASFGVKELPIEYEQLYKEELSKYDYISVREDSPIIHNLLGQHNNVVLDPTLLLDRFDWMKYAGKEPIIKGKYILCYILSYKFNPYPYVYSLVDHIKNVLGYRVVFLDNDPIRIMHGYTLANNKGPIDFVNLFLNSSFVITSSFHGTAFAINSNKPFISLINDGSDDNRQFSLIKKLGIDENCLVKCGDNPNTIKIPFIDYKIVNEQLKKQRDLSISYLKKSLE